jgi:uncharacterized membrane protein
MRGIIPAMRSAVACRGNGLALTFGMEGPSVILFRGGETHSRSVTKAISWRALGTIDTFAISWFMTGRVEIAGSIAGVEIITKIAWYYLHERIWTAVHWGRRGAQSPGGILGHHPDR